MKTPSVSELWAMPELALLPALIAAIDGLLASLHAQHGTLNDDWQPGDPPSLAQARLLVDELVRARSALRRYVRAVRASLNQAPPDQEPLPF